MKSWLRPSVFTMFFQTSSSCQQKCFSLILGVQGGGDAPNPPPPTDLIFCLECNKKIISSPYPTWNHALTLKKFSIRPCLSWPEWGTRKCDCKMTKQKHDDEGNFLMKGKNTAHTTGQLCLPSVVVFCWFYTHEVPKRFTDKQEVFWSKAVHFTRYLSGCPLIWIHLHFCSISFKARSKLCKNRLKEDGGNGTVSFAHFTRILLLLGRKHRVTKPVFN